MKKQSKTTRRVRPLTPAQASVLSPIRNAAFAAGESRARVIERVGAACGKRPALGLYQAVRLNLVIGFMASALARTGDNRPDAVLFKHCEERLTVYQGPGKGTLRKGMKGRRTEQEELAYGSARVLSSAIFKAANVVNPEKRGGDTSTTRNSNRKGSNAPAKPNPNKVPVMPKVKTPEAANDGLLRYAAALLAYTNKNASVMSNPAKSAVEAFCNAVKALPTGK